MTGRWSRPIATAICWLAAVRGAAACAVCFDDGNGVALRTYAMSTLFLSALPFCVVGGLALAARHLRRQAALQPSGTDLTSRSA